MDNKKTKMSGGHLKRELGLFSGVSLVAGMTIGSGIYYLGSYVLERTNMSMGMALICWLIGGLVSISRRSVLCRTRRRDARHGRPDHLTFQSLSSDPRLYQRLFRLSADLFGIHCRTVSGGRYPVCGTLRSVSACRKDPRHRDHS